MQARPSFACYRLLGPIEFKLEQSIQLSSVNLLP